MPGGRDAELLPRKSCLGRRARAISRRRPRQGHRVDRARADHHPGTRLRSLFPDRVGPGPLCPRCGHPLPGTRIGGQFGRLLLPGGHGRRPGSNRRPLRAVHFQGTGGSPGHRYRFRAPAQGRGDSIYLRKVWSRAGRDDCGAHHLPAALGCTGRWQGAGAVAGSRRRARQCDRSRRHRRAALRRAGSVVS
jgi:hypothetical protein